jgi:hypothetical protein
MQGASKGRLQSPAKSSNPRRAIRRFSDDEPRKLLVGLFARDAKQVCEVLVLGVHIREYVGRHVVAAAEVACVAAVATPEGLGGALDHENARPSLDGSQGCAQSGIAAAEDRDVALLGFTLHRGVPGSGRRIVPCRLLPPPAIEKNEGFCLPLAALVWPDSFNNAWRWTNLRENCISCRWLAVRRANCQKR